MKPVVTFTDVYLLPVAGQSAVIGGLRNHPAQADGDLFGGCAQTSRVERIEFDAEGRVTEFETLNTIYRRERA